MITTSRFWKIIFRIVLVGVLAACAKQSPEIRTQTLTEFTGRLIVIEPARRWQVLVNWHSTDRDSGKLRLTHAATGRIIELHWQKNQMRLRDNQAAFTSWKNIDLKDLASFGISLQPNDISLFLAGQTPSGFAVTAKNRWTGKRMDSLLKVKWIQNRNQLRITDATLGKTAILTVDD